MSCENPSATSSSKNNPNYDKEQGPDLSMQNSQNPLNLLYQLFPLLGNLLRFQITL